MIPNIILNTNWQEENKEAAGSTGTLVRFCQLPEENSPNILRDISNFSRKLKVFKLISWFVVEFLKTTFATLFRKPCYRGCLSIRKVRTWLAAVSVEPINMRIIIYCSILRYKILCASIYREIGESVSAVFWLAISSEWEWNEGKSRSHKHNWFGALKCLLRGILTPQWTKLIIVY